MSSQELDGLHHYKMGKLFGIILVAIFLSMPSLGLSTDKHTHKKLYASKPARPLHSTTSHTPSTSGNVRALMNANRIIQTNLPGYLLNDSESQLINTVYHSITTLRYSAYQLGGARIDTSRGIYIVDCSAYVDHILNKVYPQAYSSLLNWSGSQKPTSDDYYKYFNNLDKHKQHWEAVNNVSTLRPGDVLVFRKSSHRSDGTGHVMLVMDKPKRDANHYSVRVTDAAPLGHSKDTRLPHTSGIGIGTLMLKVNPHTSRPSGYAWKVGSRWKENVAIAMARPKEVL